MPSQTTRAGHACCWNISVSTLKTTAVNVTFVFKKMERWSLPKVNVMHANKFSDCLPIGNITTSENYIGCHYLPKNSKQH